MLADGTADGLYRRGGGWISITAPPRLAWVRRHRPGIWAEVRRFSMIADWMVLRLTGTLASEASIGSTSGLFDLGRRAWSPGLLAQCGLDPAWFPEVVEAGTVVGQVSARAAAQTGLAAGTLVVAGGLDTALGLAGPVPGPGPAAGRLRSPAGASGSRPCWQPRQSWSRTASCARSATSGRANGWSRASGSTPGSRCAGSGTRPPRAAGCRATPSSRNGPRRFRPAPVDLPHGWSRPTPGPGHAGSRRSRRGPRGGRGPGRGRAGRAGPGHPGSRRLLHPPDGRAGSRLAGARRRAGGPAVRRGRPQQAVAADPGRRSRLPGQRGRADGDGGPRRCDPRGARGRGTARRLRGRGPGRGHGRAAQPRQAAGLRRPLRPMDFSGLSQVAAVACTA